MIEVLDAVRDTLDSFGYTEKFLRMKKQDKVPVVERIYFLFDGDDIVYIGKSKNIHSRLNAHACDRWKAWDSFAYIEAEGVLMGALESVFIGAYRPRYNKAGL